MIPSSFPDPVKKISVPTFAGLSTMLVMIAEGFPLMIRPSYVLSGAAMAVVFDPSTLEAYLTRATEVDKASPVVVSKFIENSKEIEFDGAASNGEILIYAIGEHVENAGVHSGDATVVIPPQRLYIETARSLEIDGKYYALDQYVFVILMNTSTEVINRAQFTFDEIK